MKSRCADAGESLFRMVLPKQSEDDSCPQDVRRSLQIEHNSQTNGSSAWLRPAIQVGFVAFSILLGLQFRNFVRYLGSPTDDLIIFRPPAVEAYLPISSLMSLTYLAKTGIANRVHPAGLVIFSATLVLALLIRRGFCAWVCPIGTAAELAHKTGKLLLGRNPSMPRRLDIVLRTLKYALLGFFLYHILPMPAAALRAFIYGPYNRMADVKMFLFFRHISVTALTVIIVLGLLSMLFKNFFCRYLCPYGALLGLFSALSPAAIRRNAGRCTGCGGCGRVCPNRIAVDKKEVVRSAECTACFDCIRSCKTPGALKMSLPKAKAGLSAVAYGIITVAAFLFSAQAAQTAGYWRSETSDPMYRALYKGVSQIGHPEIQSGAIK